MKTSNNNVIDLFLNPKSVAVIGASKNLSKGGNWIVNNLLTNNFKGKVYPINPNAEGKLLGLEFKKSVLDIDEEGKKLSDELGVNSVFIKCDVSKEHEVKNAFAKIIEKSTSGFGK